MSTTTRKRKSTALAPTPAPAPAPEPEAQLVPDEAALLIQMLLVFTVDGKPVASSPMQFMVGKPADDQAVQLQVAMDARTLVQHLEPFVGPVQRVWTPKIAAVVPRP